MFHQFVPGEREVADKSEILKESPRFIDDWRNKKKKKSLMVALRMADAN